MTEAQSPDHVDVPAGWEVQVSRDGDVVRYEYVERATGERIRGVALKSAFRSPAEDIRLQLRKRAERIELRAAGVSAEQVARKIIEMVGVLHTRGYESLYLAAHMAPSGGAWRYGIGIASRGKWPVSATLGT